MVARLIVILLCSASIASAVSLKDLVARISAGQTRVLWTPASLGGNVLWFDSTYGVSISDTKVASWTDRITGIVASNTASAQWPSNSVSGINGQNTLRFYAASTNRLLFKTPANLTGIDNPRSFVYVTKGYSAAATPYAFTLSTRINYGGVNNESVGYLVVTRATDGTQYAHTGGGVYRSAVATQTTNEIAIIAITKTNGHAASLCAIYKNGTTASASTNTALNGTSESANGYLSIGQQGTPGTGLANFEAGDIIIAPRVLTAEEIQQCEGYMAWKWGIQSSLPTNHPYYGAAP